MRSKDLKGITGSDSSLSVRMEQKTASVLLTDQTQNVFNIIVFLHIKNTNDLDQENTSILQELSKHLSFFFP